MILYKSNASEFLDAVDDNRIADELEQNFITKVGHTVSPNEKRSWENSLYRMGTIVRRSDVPADCGILLEYNIPATSKRIDFLIAGEDAAGSKNFIIVELKQWESAEATDMDNLVRTYVGKGIREVTHPAYQAFSYKQFLQDMNTATSEHDLVPYSCAYLHNYAKGDPEPLLLPQYQAVCNNTPVFFKSDAKALEKFFSEHVGEGKGLGIVDTLENSKTKPSKQFISYVADLFAGNPVYTLMDEQQVAYANIVKYADSAKKRTTIIVNGGPGTGKSVVAMNAFVHLLSEEKNIRFVAPNAAFRTGMIDMLARQKENKKKRMQELFTGSASFWDLPNLCYDVLIVDEAHRLKSKGAYQYKGESQVDDVIRTSRVNVFFIDDFQRIRPDDEGTVDYIKAVAAQHGSTVIEVELKAQFRCSGADGYVNWLDNTLQIRETGNYDGWDEGAFEFKIMDDPNQLEEYVRQKNEKGQRARMLAGFAWPWTGVKENPDANVADIVIPEYDFARPWNSRKARETWAIDNEKQEQIGCVHTVQGLEFDYVGVIIGKDLRYDQDTHMIVADYNNYFDTVGKKGMKDKPEVLTAFLKNIYKVLMTRGIKGCAVYCYDEALQKHFKQRYSM